MSKFSKNVPALFAASAIALALQVASVSAVEDLSLRSDPPMLGIQWARDAKPGHQIDASVGPMASANMTYHGGKIMSNVTSKNIFWGVKWAGTTYQGDVVTGLDLWYQGHNNSNYARTVGEYTGLGQTVGSTNLVHQGHIIDTSTASGGANTSKILAEVCKQVSAGNIVPPADGNGYYAVYTDKKRGSAGYCAWHSAGTCGGKQVQFAFFWDLTGDSGCTVSDTQTGHSGNLAALGSVTAHELEEARSDPASPGAWYDASGQENGDKCAWTFNVPYVTFPNGSKWKMQGEWSNAAYTAGTGYPNSSGQRGCLDGH